MNISGKIALVTGAGQGIGRGIALRLASDGADIAIVDINDETIEQVADEVRALGRKATIFKADVTRREEVNAAIDHAEKELGGFRLLPGRPRFRLHDRTSTIDRWRPGLSLSLDAALHKTGYRRPAPFRKHRLSHGLTQSEAAGSRP